MRLKLIKERGGRKGRGGGWRKGRTRRDAIIFVSLCLFVSTSVKGLSHEAPKIALTPILSGVNQTADVSAPKPLMRRVPSKDPRKGPYQLLVKERLMSIYLAIYIHRDI